MPPAVVLVLAAALCLSTVLAHSVRIQLDFLGLQPNALDPCIGGDDVGLTNTSVLLQYRLLSAHLRSSPWRTELARDLRSSTTNDIDVTISINESAQGVQFRIIQFEHGGGGCNCWTNFGRTITVNEEQFQDPPFCTSTDLHFCGDNARDARGFITHAYYFNNAGQSMCPGDSNMLISNQGPPLPDNCANSTTRIEISYQLILEVNGDNCGGVFNLIEAIEFAVRTNDLWIPLRISCYGICGSGTTSITVRGYNVSVSTTTSPETEEVFICGDLLEHAEDIQFRWMGITGSQEAAARLDIWALSEVTAMLIRDNQPNRVLFEERFGTGVLNSTVWMNPRRGTVNCTEACLNTPPCRNQFLTFGAYNDDVSLATRIALTQPFPLQPENTVTSVSTLSPSTTSEPLSTSQLPTTQFSSTTSTPPPSPPLTTPPLTTPPLTTPPLTTHSPTSLPPTHTMTSSTTQSRVAELVAMLESGIKNQINESEELRAINNADPLEAVNLLQNATQDGVRGEDVSVVLYLLGNILNRVNSTQSSGQPDQFLEDFLDVSTALTGASQVDMVDVVGGSFLAVLDRYALQVFPTEGNISAGDISLLTQQVDAYGNNNTFITAIDSEEIYEDDMFPRMMIEIPVDVFANETGLVRTVSFVYYAIDELFPGGLPGDNSTELGSGIVSAALQCGTGRCPTENLELDTPVRITIQHSEEVEESLVETEGNITCVFWEFLIEESILSTGQWSERGCYKNQNLSNVSVTVCECDHLTHFAILLSAAPLNLSDPVTLSLEIISYVGVGVSLLAMTLTICTFLLLKALRNMRNFIHINLCISLGIAQLIFVVGVDQSSDTEEDVPTHCQAIAVLLHYFFLVSFMWMLMEGVVLYVALVRVFVKYKKLYMLAFAVSSYGIPLLYLGALTLPLGFALPTSPHNYGYDAACYLNPATHFIWAFIAPVIVIIFINFGFFIMAVTIMWRHQKKQDIGRLNNIKNWLRAAVSLVVVMGLTWIVGVLIVEVKALLPLAYIYTILVAFQGLWIFIIFVLLSKQVREAYTKWWRAKVNESDFLSKFFGDSLTFSKTTGMTAASRDNGIELKEARGAKLSASMESSKDEGAVITNHYAHKL